VKKIKLSSLIFILLIVFLVIDFTGYKLLYNNILSNHEKDTKILFYKIKSQTSDLLAKLSYGYYIQKPILLKKHKIVYDYMMTHDLNGSLDEIHQQINRGHEDKPYDIYVADKNLIIQNTTYLMDKAFDLGFAKEIFDRHWEENITGCSAPIRAKKSNNFLSYTDSYLSRNGQEKIGLLEVSYTYKNAQKELSAVQKLITQNPIVTSAKAFSFGPEGFIYELMFKDDPVYIRTSEDIIAAEKKAITLSNKLKNNDIFIETYIKDGRYYKALHMTTRSPIEEDIKVIYTIVIDENDLYENLKTLNTFIFLISILGVIAILFISKIRVKETLLSDQDKFVQSAMHEIKTPLSVITLNNELRQLEFGKDTYSEEIDSALKLLHHSYSSMSFIINKEQLTYPVEILELSKVLKDRITFFQSIAFANNKMIRSEINSHCKVDMSLIELTRFIDNNLSNAIKYSAAESHIDIALTDNRLSFHNQGEVIEDTRKIFRKYYRENNTVGGYGLGLSIIKDIAKKFHIEIRLASNTEKGTTFNYIFKCHTDDMS
jgi:signal transduction histidine kinase